MFKGSNLKSGGRRTRPSSVHPPVRTAYVEGLTMLARRELSEAQIRQRLVRKGHEADAIDAAVERLRTERALNDERVAQAIAHTEVTLRHRGKLRVRRQIEQAGIAPATARHAIDTVFGDIDDEALLEGAIERRLRGRTALADESEFRRLYRYLVGQGFESDRVVAALRKRRKSPHVDE